MSKMSKILLIASALLFSLSLFINRFRPQRRMGVLEGVNQEWVTIVIQGGATWYETWDIITAIMSCVAFGSVFCAILLWRRDRADKPQKLFLE
jgi:cyanate permease